MSGQIVGLYLKPAHKQPMKKVNETQAETGMGLVGDASFGRSKRQVLLIEQETLDEFGLSSGQVRENMTVAGITLASLPNGALLQAGEALFEITGDCAPCQQIEDIRPGLRAAMDGRRGMFCRVVEGGMIRIGDIVSLVE